MSTAAPGLSQLELGHQAPSTTRYPTCPQAELQLPRSLERPGYWLSTGEPLHNQPTTKSSMLGRQQGAPAKQEVTLCPGGVTQQQHSDDFATNKPAPPQDPYMELSY